MFINEYVRKIKWKKKALEEFSFIHNKYTIIKKLNKAKILIKDINISGGKNLEHVGKDKEFKLTLKEENKNNQNTITSNNISTDTKKCYSGNKTHFQ